MSKFIQSIIYHMKESARIIWTICLPAFVALIIGSTVPLYTLEGKPYQYLVSILLCFLSIIFLIIAIIAFMYYFKCTWQKEHPYDEYKSVGQYKKWWQWWKWNKK
jgi:hypothetical protein